MLGGQGILGIERVITQEPVEPSAPGVRARPRKDVDGPRRRASEFGDAARGDHLELADDLLVTLRGIDFEEVSLEDRVAFVRAAVDWQVHLVIERGRADLVAQLRQLEERQIVMLHGLARRRSGA